MTLSNSQQSTISALCALLAHIYADGSQHLEIEDGARFGANASIETADGVFTFNVTDTGKIKSVAFDGTPLTFSTF